MNPMKLINSISVQWKPYVSTSLTERKDNIKIGSSTSCACAGNEFELVSHQFKTRLGDVKSAENFKTEITALILHIWLASYAQRITSCIIEAVRDCISHARKHTDLSDDPLTQFYDFRLEDKCLASWIILHSLSDDPSEVNARHCLLQLFLDELPFTPTIRDDLYLACAATGSQNFFARVRMASLKKFQSRPTMYTTLAEIARGLMLPPGLVETVTVVPILKPTGFELEWFVPDMSHRLRSGLAVGTEFVVLGRVWGMYLQAPSGEIGKWVFKLCVLKPSQIDFENDDASVRLEMLLSLRGKKNAEKYISAFSNTYLVETSDLPIEGEMPETNLRSFRSIITENAWDGGCHLMLTFAVKSSPKASEVTDK